MGLGLLTETISAIVTEERNGAFYLEMEYPVSGEHAHLLTKEAYIVCNASQSQYNQRFIIKGVEKNNLTMNIYAEHYCYKANDNQIKAGVRIQDRSGVYAMDAWRRWLIAPHDFETYSDIGTSNSATFDVDVFENAKEVLAGTQGSILDVWGGEYKFDNNKISLLRQRGTARKTPIAYGRNLENYEQEESIENTKTAIYPYAKYQNKDKDGNVIEDSYHYVTLPEQYLDCDNAGNFTHRIIEKVDFSQEVLRHDADNNPLELTVDELRHLAKSYMKSNNFGVPKINIKIPFIDLPGYLVALEDNDPEPYELCDIVPVWLPKQDIQVSAKIITTEWDVLKNTYKSLTLGDAKDDLRVLFNYSQYSVINQALAKASKDLTATFTTWYNDIRVNVDEATSSLSGLEDNVGHINTKVSNLSQVVDRVDGDIITISDKMVSYENEILTLKDSLATATQSIASMRTIVNIHTSDISNLQNRVEALEDGGGGGGVIDAYTKLQSDNRYVRKDRTLSSSTNLNTIYETGFYSVRSATNYPTAGTGYGLLIVGRADLTTDTSSTKETDTVQIYIDSFSRIFTRNSIDQGSGVWTVWREAVRKNDLEAMLADYVDQEKYNGTYLNAVRVGDTVTVSVKAGTTTDNVYNDKLPSNFCPSTSRRCSVAYHNSSSAIAIWCFNVYTSGWVYCNFTTISDGGYVNTNRSGGTIQHSVSFTYNI